MTRTLPALLAAVLFIRLPAAAQSIHAYNGAVLGTNRQVALGGAVVALPDDYTAIFINPAGLSGLAEKGGNFGFESNRVSDLVVDLDHPTQRARDASTSYSFAGFRYVGEGDWGVGAVRQVPFGIDDTFYNQGDINSDLVDSPPSGFTDRARLRTSLETFTVAAGKAFLDRRLGVGVALNRHQASGDFDLDRPATGEATHLHARTREAYSADLGLLWAEPRFNIGLAYRMPTQLSFSESDRAAVPNGYSWFKDLYVPHRLSLGAAVFPLRKKRLLRLLVQTDYVPGSGDTYLAGSGAFPGTNDPLVPDNQYDTWDGRWGVEVIPVDLKNLTVRLWAGGYFEPTGLQGGFSRYHNTAGLSVEPWIIGFSVAIDDAPYYQNFAFGAGVDILETIRRLRAYRDARKRRTPGPGGSTRGDLSYN